MSSPFRLQMTCKWKLRGVRVGPARSTKLNFRPTMVKRISELIIRVARTSLNMETEGT